jgi:hypothetical protein
MLCQLCNQREATIQITTTVGDGPGGLAAGNKLRCTFVSSVFWQ